MLYFLRVTIVCLLYVASGGGALAAEDTGPNFGGPLKIAKLLWKTNHRNSATTLTRVLSSAVERGQLDELVQELEPFQALATAVVTTESATGNAFEDPRFAVSLAILSSTGSLTSADLEPKLLLVPDIDERIFLLRIWLAVDQDAAREFFAKQLTDTAAADDWKVRILQAMLSSDLRSAAPVVLQAWPQLSPAQRVAAIEPLSASIGTMTMLVDEIAAENIEKHLVNTNQLRKWLQGNSTELAAKIESIWGKIRESDNAERQQLVAETIDYLNSGVSGSYARGQVLFGRVCSQCHQLHGQGFEVGPNIQNNGRGSLEQLVSNVLDPSLVIGEAFQAKTVLTLDGEIVAGLVVAETEDYLELKVQGGKLVRFDMDEIEGVREGTKSLMPEGLESQMTKEELADLFAFLCVLKPLGSEDNSVIAGTPEKFVEP